MPTPYEIAQGLLGAGEVPDRAKIQEFLADGGVNMDPVEQAWCAAFLNASLGQAGIEGTGSNMARSFLEWGQPVEEPQPGDIAVFSRGDPNGPYGHAGFFQGYNPDGTINVLGGNQGDSVSVAAFSPDNLLGFRRAEGQNELSAPSFDMPDPFAERLARLERANALSAGMWQGLDPEMFMSRRTFG